jgi:hypothetical protein
MKELKPYLNLIDETIKDAYHIDNVTNKNIF